MDDAERPPRVIRRLAWFALLWLGGVLVLGAVAFAIRAVLHGV